MENKSKNNKNVTFPKEKLDVSTLVHIYFKEINPNIMYYLYGVSIHSGTLDGGHYTANVKNMTGDKRWYKWDDSITKETEEPTTSGWSPYVLFYLRSDLYDA